LYEEEKELVEVDVNEEGIEEISVDEQKQEAESKEEVEEKKESQDEVDEIEELRKSLKALFSDPEALIEQYVQLYKELKETKEKRDEYLYLAQKTQANLENYRKQVHKDQQWANFHNKSKILEKFLSIYDDLARTQAEFDKNPDIEHVKEALRMIFDNFKATFDNLEVKVISPKEGEKFNPRIHEAIHVLELEDKENNSIVEVVSLGFMLQDLVLRPAKVVISKVKSKQKDENKD